MSGDGEIGAVVAFELVGGPGCGKVVEMVLKQADTYLLAYLINGRTEVWAYRFVNRSTKRGWVLEVDRFVGFRGMPVEG